MMRNLAIGILSKGEKCDENASFHCKHTRACADSVLFPGIINECFFFLFCPPLKGRLIKSERVG